jgi:hypothetical protein
MDQRYTQTKTSVKPVFFARKIPPSGKPALVITYNLKGVFTPEQRSLNSS